MTASFDWTFSNENPIDDLISIVEPKNPEIAELIKNEMVILGMPAAVKPTEENGWKNTSITLTSKLECKYPGTTTLYYNRLPINLTEDDHHANTGASSAYELYLNIGGDKNNVNCSTFDPSNEFQFLELKDKIPFKAVYSGSIENTKNYPVDFNLPSFKLNKNTEFDLAVSRTSLRYVEGSKLKIIPIIGDPSLSSIFANTIISPFYFNNEKSLLPTPMRKKAVTGTYTTNDGYTREDFRLKRKYRLCCEFGIDISVLCETKMIAPTLKLCDMSQQTLDHLKKFILAPQGIKLLADKPSDFYSTCNFFTRPYRNNSLVGLPPKEGYSLEVMVITGGVVDATYSSFRMFYASNAFLTMYGDTVGKPEEFKYKDFSTAPLYDTDYLTGSKGGILLPYYVKR